MSLIRKTPLFITLISLLSVGGQQLHAQDYMVLRLNGESNQSIDLNTIQKVVFQDNSIIINYTDGTLSPYLISSIDKIQFNISTGTDLETVASDDKQFMLYPNPAVDVIYIKTSEEYIDLAIYSLDGKLIRNFGNRLSNESINISFLSSGLYLVKVNNHILKLIKR